jgi:hypothetical protein
MTQKTKATRLNKFKNFFSQLLNRIDKGMEEKAKSQTCCCKPLDKEKKSCCN